MVEEVTKDQEKDGVIMSRIRNASIEGGICFGSLYIRRKKKKVIFGILLSHIEKLTTNN